MQFLAGDLSGEAGPLRPPWALPEGHFVDQCTCCGDCVKACGDGLIQIGRGGYPRMDFSAGGCDFCRCCVEACKPRALDQSRIEDAPPWRLGARILDSCLSLGGVICRACAEVCDPRAIVFRPQVGGVSVPLLDRATCTGCGACFPVCPVNAVRIYPKAPHDQAA